MRFFFSLWNSVNSPPIPAALGLCLPSTVFKTPSGTCKFFVARDKASHSFQKGGYIWTCAAEGCKSAGIIFELIQYFSYNFKLFQMQIIVMIYYLKYKIVVTPFFPLSLVTMETVLVNVVDITHVKNESLSNICMLHLSVSRLHVFDVCNLQT